MKLKVDEVQRNAKKRAHTATHLLHSQLEKIFPNTQQSGSYVDQDYFRFDFKSERLLTNKELSLITKSINNIITSSLQVNTKECKIKEAQDMWAKAFFEDKYWDIVRVISILDNENPISIELCWGSHVANTSEIWAFSIISQEAVASGIKRIIAVTWPKVSKELLDTQKILEDMAQNLWVTTKQFPEKLDKTIKELKELKIKYKTMQTSIIRSSLKDLISKANGNELFQKIIKIDETLKEFDFKDIVLESKILCEKDLLIVNENANFAIISSNANAKSLATKYKLKWWWNESLVQWKDSKVLEIL